MMIDSNINAWKKINEAWLCAYIYVYISSKPCILFLSSLYYSSSSWTSYTIVINTFSWSSGSNTCIYLLRLVTYRYRHIFLSPERWMWRLLSVLEKCPKCSEVMACGSGVRAKKKPNVCLDIIMLSKWQKISSKWEKKRKKFLFSVFSFSFDVDGSSSSRGIPNSHHNISSTSPQYHQHGTTPNAIGKTTTTTTTTTTTSTSGGMHRRESFLYKCDSDNDLSPKCISRNPSIGSEL